MGRSRPSSLARKRLAEPSRRSTLPAPARTRAAGEREPSGRGRGNGGRHGTRRARRARTRAGPDARTLPCRSGHRGRRPGGVGQIAVSGGSHPERPPRLVPGIRHLFRRAHARDRSADRGVSHRHASCSRERSGTRDRLVHRHRRVDRTAHRTRRSGVANATRPTRRDGAHATRTVPRSRDQHHRGWLPRHVRRSRGAVQCAHALINGARLLGIDLRAGVHVGECEVRGDDLAGIAVHIGARVCALARAGEVLATTTVRDLVAGSGITFTDRGRHTLKGVADEWAILAANL